MAGFTDKRNGPLSSNSRPFSLSNALKTLSSFGMRYDDMVLRQSQAIGPMEDQFGYKEMNPFGLDNDDIYGAFAALSMGDINMKKNVPFFDIDYPGKRDELRKFAMNDEIEDILDILCDEAVVYDDKNFFAQPEIMGLDVSDDVQKDLNKYFRQIYHYFGFNGEQSAWYFFRKFLVDGYLSFEIIYSPDQKEIIGFKEIDPVTLMPGYNNDDGKKVWIQFKDDPTKERVLYDSQIIYIAYSSLSTASRVSYVERLIRSFNLLRIMEHTRVIWAVTNASFRMKFIIPVGGKSKTRAKQSLAQLMNNYKEVVDFDFESGTLETDGKPMLQFSKEYWLPSKDGEQPEIETLSSEGPDLSDTEAVKYFQDKLKEVSKIPYNRFLYEDDGGDFALAGDGMVRDEIKFGKFIKRLRSVFQEILVKPLYIQMCLKYPEFTDDPQFKTQVALRYNEENMFAELKEQEIMSLRLDFISSMRDSLMTTNQETMEEEYYFDQEYLVRKYLKLSDDEVRANQAFKAKDRKNAAEEPEEEDDGMGI
jgi:hypothetical protein|tara:strand:- start:1791 stop:3389 length:1599 start_codon:yes stop_codon:yes gene_type:complete